MASFYPTSPSVYKCRNNERWLADNQDLGPSPLALDYWNDCVLWRIYCFRVRVGVVWRLCPRFIAWCPRFASVFWTLTWAEEGPARPTEHFASHSSPLAALRRSRSILAASRRRRAP